MQTIFKYLVRGLAVIGFFVVLTSAVGWAIVFFHEKPALPEKIVLRFDFTRMVKEKGGESPIDFALGRETGDLSLRDVVAVLELAARDDRVEVVFGTFRENMASMPAVQEMQEALLTVREAGKHSVAFAPSFGELGPADKAYYLASAFDEVWMQPMGLVGLTGLAVEMPFARTALNKIGVKPDFVHREEFKSAMDSFTENDFTAANTLMLDSILDDLSSQMIDDIAANRGLEPLAVMRAMDAAPLLAEDAVVAGLVDALGYKDEVEDRILARVDVKAEIVEAANYLALRRAELEQEHEGDADRPTIAFIHAEGPIMQGGGAVAATEEGILADDMAQAVEDAVNDDAVEAILLRLDSPGGSAVASDTIRRALERAQHAGLPLVVSMGSVAGSGGYWIASAGDVIFADPATLTGSIGVIAGKFAGTDVWEKLGVNWGGIARGQYAGMWSSAAPFTDDERTKLDALVGATYDAFKQRVADGRDLSAEDVARLAKGRVWTGAAAADNGLVDAVGGLADAILYTKNLLGLLEDDAVFLKVFPAPESPFERFMHMLEDFGGMGVVFKKLGVTLRSATPLFDLFMHGSGLQGRQAVMPLTAR